MNRKARRIAEKKARQKKARRRGRPSKDEIRAAQSFGGRIGAIRRTAKKCGLDPDDIVYSKTVNGQKRYFPGRLLLERGFELPMLTPDQQRELERRRGEAEWAELVRRVAEQDGRSEQEVADEIVSAVRAEIESGIEDVMGA